MTWVTRLNHAMKKKAAMQECTSDLGLTITGQETMMVLQKHAMHGEDLCHYPAGRSGSHGVRQSCQPNLCRGDGVPRLLQLGEDNGPRRAALRFVKWLEMAPKESKT